MTFIYDEEIFICMLTLYHRFVVKCLEVLQTIEQKAFVDHLENSFQLDKNHFGGVIYDPCSMAFHERFKS